VKRLITRLQHSSHRFFVHVDGKNPAAVGDLADWAADRGFSNVVPGSDFNITQGGNLILRASVRGLQRAVDTHKEWAWDYWIKLSETDYPVASVRSLHEFLAVHQGLNFVGMDACRHTKCSRPLGITCGGQTFSFFNTLRMHKPAQYGLHFVRGSEWVALTYDFAKEVAEGLDQKDSAIAAVWRDSLLQYQPDESFFHSAIANVASCAFHVNRNLHFITGIDVKSKHGEKDEVGTRSPATMTEDYLPAITAAKKALPRFFTRKLLDYDKPETARLIQRLDEAAACPPVWKDVTKKAPGWLEGLLQGRVDGAAEFRAKYEVKEGAQVWRAGPDSSCPSEEWSCRPSELRIGSSAGARVILAEKFGVWPRAKMNRRPDVLALRVGTKWCDTSLRFLGSAGLVHVGEQPAAVVHLLQTTESAHYKLTVEWVSPGKAITKSGPKEVYVGHEPVSFRIPAGASLTTGEWTVKIRLLQVPAEDGSAEEVPNVLAGARKFLVYGDKFPTAAQILQYYTPRLEGGPTPRQEL